MSDSIGRDTDTVDFLVVGAQKAGTTALHRYLQHHPQIGLANTKEVQYFNDDDHFRDQRPNHDVYHRRFPEARPGLVRGEATPIYMYWVPAIERIWRYNPDMRLIVLLRDPVERAYAQWNMERSRERDSLEFFESLLAEQGRAREALPAQHRTYSYIDRGLYCEQIRRIWRFFPSDQVLIMRSEHLRGEPERVLHNVCEFLGVDTGIYDSVGPIVEARGLYEQDMDPRAHELLRSVFQHEIRQLEQMMSWDLTTWLG